MLYNNIINEFIKNNEFGIIAIQKENCHNTNLLLADELMIELKNGCISFFNKERDLSELDAYLFYIVNDFYKRRAVLDTPQIKKKIAYLCPGCLFLGKEHVISISNNLLKCNNCNLKLKTIDDKDFLLFKTFAIHNKNGYRCKDCERFIPHPMNNMAMISCPYYDCMFAGTYSSLKKMNHPTALSNINYKLTDQPIDIIEPNVINTLLDVINSQKDNIQYTSSNFTIIHKKLAFDAISNLLISYPDKMIKYLLENSRSGGFQHKIFQEYIILLERSLPYYFNKGNAIYKVESLLDKNINLFDGISSFDAKVSNSCIIKNNTKEFYIGGRKASYTKPYYIGKLLNVEDKLTKQSLIDCVEEYSFSKIKMKNIKPNTEVIITHLRVIPHYQMGGMVYINRARKQIIDNMVK